MRVSGGATNNSDITDRAARLLGVIASITAAVDVSDRVGRTLGVVKSITDAVDVSDRVGRALGVVASITSAVDVSDKAARILGRTTPGLEYDNQTYVTGNVGPVAGTTICDTGALAAGLYDVSFMINYDDTAGYATLATMDASPANIKLTYFFGAAGARYVTGRMLLAIVANGRVRSVMATTGGSYCAGYISAARLVTT